MDAVLGEPPALAGVGQGAQKMKAEAVVDQGSVVLPGELDEGVAPVGEAFGEVFVRDLLELEDAAGFQVFHTQGGLAFDAGALVEMAVEVNETLGEGLGIVRVGVDDLVGVGRDGEGGGDCAEKEGEKDADAAARWGEKLQGHRPP